MSLTIVSAAYPIVPIGPDTVGGTEQVVSMLDAALVRAGHRSIVVAAADSRIAGELIPTPAEVGPLDEAGWEQAYAVHRETLRRVLGTVDADLVHMHGVDFHKYLPEGGPPMLATLHLPPFNYPEDVTHPKRPLTFLNCVSRFSRGLYPEDAPIVVIPNGVPLDRFQPRRQPKEDLVVALGRVVPEKGFHLAIEACKRAGLRLVIGGKVPPFPEHQQYFREQIHPRLDADRRFLGVVPLAQRIDLLARARCLIIPSLIDESNPLVAMEALASGTPVVARRVGSLPDNLEEGTTGLFADDVASMADAIEAVADLEPQECRRSACERFSAERMTDKYIDVYEMIAAMGRLEAQWRELTACSSRVTSEVTTRR